MPLKMFTSPARTIPRLCAQACGVGPAKRISQEHRGFVFLFPRTSPTHARSASLEREGLLPLLGRSRAAESKNRGQPIGVGALLGRGSLRLRVALLPLGCRAHRGMVVCDLPSAVLLA